MALLLAGGMKKSSAAQLFPIDKFMTHSPHVIAADATLSKALRSMRELGVRHLPVLDRLPQGKLVGILSERDIFVLEALREVDPDRVAVSAAMQTDVYGVDADTPLDEVSATMASHKYGSAVVWRDGSVVGIFTMVDAARALTDCVRKWTR